MAKFNESAAGKYTDPAKAETRNYENAPAYNLSDKVLLYSLVCTSLVADKFYTTAQKDVSRLRALVAECDPEFVAKLAVYAREQMHLRSIPVAMTVELVRKFFGARGLMPRPTLLRALVSRVVQRPDEITEMLAYYANTNGNGKSPKKLSKLSTPLKRGLADAFSKFDAYQLAKYKQEDKDITLRDALFLCHPKPKDATQALTFKQLADRALPTPFTWETELSEKGNKKEVWEGLIASKKMGYMATLRNLRNIVKANVSQDALESVCAFLSDPKAVASSRQLPFRFFSAYRELLNEHTFLFDRRVTEALENAAVAAAANIKGFAKSDRVLVACDTSGSMEPPISPKSSVKRYEIGLVLASFLHSVTARCQAGIFGDSWIPVNLPSSNILANTQMLKGFMGKAGHSTNGWKVIDWAMRENLSFDKMVFFTDCQWWDSDNERGWGESLHAPSKLWARYKQKNPKAVAYFVDLAGYGTTPIKAGKNDVWFVAGWSERMFEAIEAIEQGRDALGVIDAVRLF